MKIGFIGTGVMGTGMINNLLKANYAVTVYNRTKAHAATVLHNGAKWAASPQQVAQETDIVITIVGFPQDVQEVYYGTEGIFAGVHSGQLLIDMTTSTPKLAQEIAQTAQENKVAALDAPVSGGDVGAKKGTLTIMVGGNKTDFDLAKPVFAAMGTSIHLFGASGQGQNAKMANQIMIAGTMTGMTESLVYAKKAGLNLESLITMIAGGSAQNWSMTNYGPRILQADFAPGFAAKHFLKDLKIALTTAKEMKLNLPATAEAEKLYEKMVKVENLGDLGTQALIKVYSK